MRDSQGRIEPRYIPDFQPRSRRPKAARSLVAARLALVALVTLGLLRAAQGADDADQALDECSLYPLPVGREWHYRSEQLEIVERVAAHEKLGDELCARVETVFQENVVAVEHVAVRNDGVYRIAIGGQRIEPAFRFLALPAKNGDRWPVESTVAGQLVRGEFETSTGSLKIANQDLTVVTVSGRHLQIGRVDIEVACSFSENIGKVQQKVVSHGRETTLTLKSIPGTEGAESQEPGLKL